jgi:polysaccharide biosynthesis/export protein
MDVRQTDIWSRFTFSRKFREFQHLCAGLAGTFHAHFRLWSTTIAGRPARFTQVPEMRLTTIIFAAVSSLSWGGAAWAQGAATAPVPSVQSPAAQAPQVAAPAVGPNYLIGPGDSLQVFVWRNPDLSTVVPVRPDGKISTPLVEDMVAVGKTPSNLARDIEHVLGEFIRSPQVNVIVTIPVSALSQVKVIGQVTNPQSLPYREGMRVLDAVLASGGLAQYAAGNRAKIVRKQGDKQTELRIKLDSLINKGDMKQNLELKPGDVIVVPESIL